MITLGIETSCDESSICILETKGVYPALGYRVLSHLIHSQIEIHAKYGGVYPMLAKREHAKRLVPLLLQAIDESSIAKGSIETLPEAIENVKKICGEHDEELCRSILGSSLVKVKPAIDRIAVTHGPGLEPALWVGINFANALGSLWNIPVTGINHMEGHIMASLAQDQDKEAKYSFERLKECSFPAITFLISGGHTEIVYIKEIGDYEVLGQTRDDAIGEAFDKVARMLGLPYPGGPEISRLAEMERRAKSNKSEASPKDRANLAEPDGAERRDFSAEKSRVSETFGSRSLDDRTITLPRPMIDSKTLDMSFSGLKTAVLYELRKHETIDDDLQKKVAREFEDAVTDVIVSKLELAFDIHEAHALILGGGVTANKHILKACKDFADRRNVAFLPPARGLSGDNALMIALAGALNKKKVEEIRAQGNLSLDDAS